MDRPTINDVAKAAGVSKSAVSFALNGRPGVAVGTRERILATARRLGWRPNARARALSVSKALAAGLVIARQPETLRSDPFFPAFIAGLEGVLSEHGYALLLQVCPNHDRELASYRRLAEEWRVDGVFVTDMLVDDPRPALLAELGLAAVIVGPGLDDSYWPAVGVDGSPGVVAVVEHLVDFGHVRLAHVAGPSGLVHGQSRREAFSRCLHAAGLPEGRCIEADFSAEGGATATRQLLDDPEPPSAIVYANDLMALAGLGVALGRGIEVPAELSIAGYDDIELSAHSQPPLTTVSSDVLGWGRAAASCLLDLVAGRAETGTDLPPPQLVVRASTGPAPTAAPARDHGRPSARTRRSQRSLA